MPSLVIDSSLSASWCFPDEQAEYANAILKAMSGPAYRKGIPAINSRVAYTLSRSVSYEGVFSLANRCGLTVYDAAYLDLAINERLPLASLDNALCKAALNAGVALFRPQ